MIRLTPGVHMNRLEPESYLPAGVPQVVSLPQIDLVELVDVLPNYDTFTVCPASGDASEPLRGSGGRPYAAGRGSSEEEGAADPTLF